MIIVGGRADRTRPTMERLRGRILFFLTWRLDGGGGGGVDRDLKGGRGVAQRRRRGERTQVPENQNQKWDFLI